MFSPLKVNTRGDFQSTPSKSTPSSGAHRWTKSPHNSRLEALKGHNSFKNMSTPKKNPEENSSEEPFTPKDSYGRKSPTNKTHPLSPLMVDINHGDMHDFVPISPSPIGSYHHNFKEKVRVPENKAYNYSCSGEVSRPLEPDGDDSPHDRRQKEKKSQFTDKHVTYSAEYLRPIEEFIYPSLRPSKEEFERRRQEAKKNRDFSLPDQDNGQNVYDLQWKISEGKSLVEKPDLSSTVLYNITDKGEKTLRNHLTNNFEMRVRHRRELEALEEEEEHSVNNQKATKQLKVARKNVLGNLFGKTKLLKEAHIYHEEKLNDNPNQLYYDIKNAKDLQDKSDRHVTFSQMNISRQEMSYIENKQDIAIAAPGLDESSDHFKGLMFYKMQKSISEQKMNDMLTKHTTPNATKNSSMDMLGDLDSQLSGGKSNTSSIAQRQHKFLKQRAASSFATNDPEEEKILLEEHAKMAAQLPPASMNSAYSCCVINRIKRVTNTINNNMDATTLSRGSIESDNSSDDTEWNFSSVEQKKRFAQDSLIFREIRAGLIPEQLLKKIPRMGAMICLDLSYFSLGDELCECLAKSLDDLEMLHTLGLRANRLTFKSLNMIFNHVNVKGFRHLDISMNDVSGTAVDTLCEFLMRSDCKMSSLELMKTNLNRKTVKQICRAITHPETSWIMELSLARNSLDGRAMPAIADALKYPGCSLSWMDLSWNSFDSQSGAILAEALAVNQTLTSLDLSANSLRDDGGQRIAATLLQNKHLQEIYLSLNNIGGKSCFIFSKVLRNHPSMTRLNLSDNPLTEAGARSIFRTILRGLKCFVMMQSCTFLNETGLFNHSNPSLDSPYTLNLDEPYHVSVLSEMIQMVNLNKTCRFSGITYKEKENDSKSLDISADVVDGETYLCSGSTPWAIPNSGILKLKLTHRPRIPTVDMAIDDLAYNTILAIVVNARSENDRKNWLFLMCMDAFFTTEQAQDLIDILDNHHLLGNGGGISIVDFFYCLWSNIIDVVNIYDFYHRNLDVTKRLSLIHALSFEKFRFNWVNPSGHWRLDLGNKVQRSVMMQLIALNGSESKASRRAKRGDTSQKGNYCNFRNEKLSGTEVEINIEFTKSLPWFGVLEFDYVTTTRPRPDSELISDDDFVLLLQNLELSPRRRLDSKKSNLKLLELQLAVTKHCFSPERILKIMNCFAEDANTQVRVIVCMFGRLVELHDFDTILRHISASAIHDVLCRIGVLNCLNPLKPCLDLRLNLKYMDNRILVHAYLQMSSAEGGDQLKQHPRSEIDIIALYASLGRLIADSVEGTLMFTYCEVGEREAPLDWKLRKEAISRFLLGNQPRHPKMMKLVQWYKEIKKAGLLTLGPLDIQYMDYKKQMALKSMNIAFGKKPNKAVSRATALLKSAASSALKNK